MVRTQKVLMACQDIRRLGSAALDICWVACGRLDGYFESLSPWDFAAARVIALEAGAKMWPLSKISLTIFLHAFLIKTYLLVHLRYIMICMTFCIRQINKHLLFLNKKKGQDGPKNFTTTRD